MKMPLRRERLYKLFYEACVVGFIFLLVFIILLQSPQNIFWKTGVSKTDSSVFKTVAMYMDHGLMPYKDVFDHKGPLLYLYNWIGMQLSYWRGIWVIEFISLFCAFFIFYKTARLLCGRICSCLSLMAATANLFYYFEGGNLTEEYALPFIGIALFIFVDYFLNDKISVLRLAVCGGAFGAVCLLRANMVSVWIVFCIAVLVKNLLQRSYQKLGRFVIWFFAGFCIICFPFMIWLMKNGAFKAFINDYIIFNLKYSASASSSNIYNVFSWFLNNSIVLVSATHTLVRAKHRNSIFDWTYLVYFIFTMLLISMSGRKHAHYGMILIPVLIYPIAEIFQILENAKDKSNSASGVIGTLLMATVVLPSWITGLDAAVQTYANRENYKNDFGVTGEVVKMIQDYSTADEKIVVWGNNTEFYVLSKRLSASQFVYQSPPIFVDPDIHETFFSEIKKTPPKLVITCMELGKMKDFLKDNDYKILGEFENIKVYVKERG